MDRRRPADASSWTAILAFAGLVPNCGYNVVAEQPDQSAAAAPRAVTERPVPAASGTPWTHMARPSVIEERQGDPITMAEGERCEVYRRLPALRYVVSTLIQDACLEIPSGTIVEVAGGVTLVIVATNGLRLGQSVTFNAKGAGGRRGARAPFASVRREVETDAEIRTLCVDRGNQCECPSAASASQDAIRGRIGEQGSAGGNIYVVAAALATPAGFSSNVSGGVGGPPGDSGTHECVRGDVRCSSPVCSAGASFGAPGSPGQVLLTLAGSTSAAAIAWTRAHTTPPGVLSVAELGSSILERARELDNDAVQKGFQRRSGRAP